uniref:Uncharacterized protein n=1 Tax=Vombatus ursinus TaxID=29139 RepID=A0A4X2K869_VOMUR
MIKSSMDWPCSKRFSISMSSFTPSTTICTSSTSEKPNRSALEMSKTPPTAAVSTPPASFPLWGRRWRGKKGAQWHQKQVPRDWCHGNERSRCHTTKSIPQRQ